MRRLLMALALGTSALVTGACAGSGTATYGVSASYSTPDLAYVSPGVYVVADYDQPVFYTNNLYWRYDNGTWYQSRYYDRGWRYSAPPRALVTINQPYAYVRYRANTRYEARPNGRVIVRDHRRVNSSDREYWRRNRR